MMLRASTLNFHPSHSMRTDGMPSADSISRAVPMANNSLSANVIGKSDMAAARVDVVKAETLAVKARPKYIKAEHLAGFQKVRRSRAREYFQMKDSCGISRSRVFIGGQPRADGDARLWRSAVVTRHDEHRSGTGLSWTPQAGASTTVFPTTAATSPASILHFTC